MQIIYHRIIMVSILLFTIDNTQNKIMKEIKRALVKQMPGEKLSLVITNTWYHIFG